MEWDIVYYSDDVQQAIAEFPPGIQARYIHLTERMGTFGLKSKEGIGRVFFFTQPGERIMMVHAFVKKSAKTPVKELKVARDRMRKAQKDDDA